MMKCQKCSKTATYHITDVDNGKWTEFHYCEEHARQFLDPSEETSSLPVSNLAKDLVAASTSPEALQDDNECPVCGMTLPEFRKTGRLGCAHDYDVFRDELMPLLENIHEQTRHIGKRPRRAPRSSEQQLHLVKLRNDLKKAISTEDYEKAAQLRDQIKEIETEFSTRQVPS